MNINKNDERNWGNIVLNLLYLVILGGVIIRVFSKTNPNMDLVFLINLSTEIIAQTMLFMFIFRNSAFIQDNIIRWLTNASLIGTLGIGAEIIISWPTFLGSSRVDLQLLIAINLFLLCFFIFTYLTTNHKKMILFLSMLSIGFGLNAIVIGLQTLTIDYNNSNGFINLLLGLQIVFFVTVLALEKEPLYNLYSSNKSKFYEKAISLDINKRLEGIKIALIVIAHNEERLILKTLSSVPRIIEKIYVVNDGSTDKTAELVMKYTKEHDPRIELINHKVNKGAGAAVITGYWKAYEDNYDIAVVVGADAQMDMNDLPNLLEPIIKGEADYVKGNRFIYGNAFSEGNAFKEMPKLRIIGNIILSLLTKVGSGYRNIFDSQMGYTAIRREVIPKIDWEKARQGYGYPGDWLIRFHVSKLKVKDVPVRAIYLKNERQTQIKVRKYIFYTSYVMLKAYLFRLKNEYFSFKNITKKRFVPQSLLFLSLFLAISGIVVFPLFPSITFYALTISLQSGIFFIVSDLILDNLSIPTKTGNF